MRFSEIIEGKSAVTGFGMINIIAASTVRTTNDIKMLSSDGCLKVYDLSVAEFRTRPGVIDEPNWQFMYVNWVMSTIAMSRTYLGKDDKTTTIILITDDEEVRRILSEKNIVVVFAMSENAINRVSTFNTEIPIIMDNMLSDNTPGALMDLVYRLAAIPIGYRSEQSIKPSMVRKLKNYLMKKVFRHFCTIDNNGHELAQLLDEFEIGINSHGRLYLVDRDNIGYKFIDKFANKNHLPSVVREKIANAGSHYVVLNREDAVAIIDMLNDAIRRLESGTRSDNDVEVFGDKAISYERLIDEVDHTLLPEPKDEDADG